MAKLFNLARMTTATTGTGTITLGSAVSGYLTFALAGVANSDVVSYAIKDGANSEIGTGTYTTSGTTLTRNVSNSTNSNAAISLSGAAEVFITPRAADLRDDAYGLVNHGISVSASAGALTVNLTDSAGATPSDASPVRGYFRNATETTGSWSQLIVSSSLSLTVTSGATLAATSSKAFRLWVVLFNDGGTARLGVINCSTYSAGTTNIYPLDSYSVASSTAMSASASSAGVFYTGTAVTSKAYLIVGFVEWGASGLTAGTWTTTNLARLQSFGPGISKPGDVVQQVNTQSNASNATSSTTYVTASVIASITPKSACNPIRIALDIGLDNNTMNATTSIDLNRGATSLAGVFVVDGILSFAKFTTTGGVTPTSATIYDFPNTTSSTAYGVMWKVTGGTATLGARTGGAFSQPTSFAVWEIMG